MLSDVILTEVTIATELSRVNTNRQVYISSLGRKNGWEFGDDVA